MPESVTIRPRRDHDIPALADALVRVHAVDGYPVEGVADPAGFLRHPHELMSWTAQVGGTPVGQVMLTRATPDDDAARVWHERTGGAFERLAMMVRLFVDPNHRTAGAGRQLITVAVDHACALGLSVAFDVMEKDKAAIRLYERMGALRLDAITHHHSDGLSEPAAVYVASPRPSWPVR